MFNLNPTEHEWTEAALDLPFSTPMDAKSPGEAMLIPGCCLKSVERERPGGWPKYFARLVSIDQTNDRVLVISQVLGDSPRFLWTGTMAEYTAVWDCD